MIQFVSGLDWSGDPGDPRRQAGASPDFAIAIATAPLEDISAIEERLNICRKNLVYGPTYVFHHKESDTRTKASFFEAMQGLPISVVVNYIDRRNWSPEYFSCTSGPERIRRAIGDAVHSMNCNHIEHGIMLVDQRRDEKNFIGHLRRDLRAVTNEMGIAGFAKIAPRPDHRDDTQMIQIADMFAGDVRRNRGSFLHTLSSITIVKT